MVNPPLPIVCYGSFTKFKAKRPYVHVTLGHLWKSFALGNHDIYSHEQNIRDNYDYNHMCISASVKLTKEKKGDVHIMIHI